ncbi:MAG: imidazole glycerol phosphate synthase subunit HisH [Bacteroidales bacterium]|nr:imidazole glycerol phosphate synthase subunit HisH [Bacteroidales bacterium]
MKITIIDYGAGNLFSVANACRRLGHQPVLSSDEHTIKNSDRVIFPGVGNAVTAMRNIRSRGLHNVIPKLTQPVLGICLGMQLLFEKSDEGETSCLAILDGSVSSFSKDPAANVKIPHMGWNIIDNTESPLLAAIPAPAYMYFVHSYYVPHNSYTIANSYYNGRFSAAVQKDNFYGCQFHPEKSGPAGIQILKNFLEL